MTWHHVYYIDSVGLEHNTNGTWCWCDPTYSRLCVVCFGEECAACQGSGFMEVDADDPALALVLHRREGSSAC